MSRSPLVPAEPWWIMIRGWEGRNASRRAPPERIIAAADMPMPTQIVDTSGSTCCITS